MYTMQEFHKDVFHEINNSADANNDFLQTEFVDYYTSQLEDIGEIDNFIKSFYKADKGMQVNGYSFSEMDGILDLFVADFRNTRDIDTITMTQIEANLKRLENFFEKSFNSKYYEKLEESSEGFSLSYFIHLNRNAISNVRFFLLTDASLSSKADAISRGENISIPSSYEIWDLSRLYKLISSQKSKEDYSINFEQMFGSGLKCLSANTGESEYSSYMAVIPGSVLADIYEKHGVRLLEQNVRCFLQFKGKVNKGIRKTILTRPDMFFAFNNGITTTAEDIVLNDKGEISELKNFQIVNGGQTTVSIYSARKKDKANISNLFVQMKLSVVPSRKAVEIVPEISEYANSQNKVNAADFFANRPYHVRVEEFSRRIWAPAAKDSLKQTKWFYERANGQYADGYYHGTPTDKTKWELEYPKKQKITKTDLAKYESAWLKVPHIVSKGGQYAFAYFGNNVCNSWDKDDTQFNEEYYKQLIAHTIIFKKLDDLVKKNIGNDYKANIVAYTISLLSDKLDIMGRSIDLKRVWDKQDLYPSLENTLKKMSVVVKDELFNNPEQANIGQACKKESCWNRIQKLDFNFSQEFISDLIDPSELKNEIKSERKTQKIDNGIESQKKVMSYGMPFWNKALDFGKKTRKITPKDEGIIKSFIKQGFVSEKQSICMLECLDKLSDEGLVI